jgi:HEPN domain-containing protein
MAEEARQFLRLARRDFRAAEGLLDSHRFDEASWGFHVQQAAEKALKAWACHEDVEFPLTHDLRLLLGLLGSRAIDVAAFRELEILTVFAVQFRYHDDLPPLDLRRQEWMERLEALIRQVEQVVGP